MKYPKEYLDEIKLRLKVSNVVSKTVQLKKRGKEFVGLSPFKNEKSPSFTVSDEKEFYHCFSTGEHGNIFDFLMKTKSMGFGEAVKTLAAEAGMQPFRFSNYDEKKEKKFKIYKDILLDYKNFFHKELINGKNIEALDYLKKRCLNKSIIEEFQLGYVPWKNDFYTSLVKKFSEEEINETRLYYKSDKTQKYIDRFNNRIIFPINNLSEDTVAFGGRIIKESKLAKYINSPETEFYKKGRMMFNLDKAKTMRSATREVIIVEGYMDVISLYSSGIKNVVSNSGTALTESQIELVWKFFSDPILCLDGDQSGQKAAVRIAERFFSMINENNKIYFSVMPDGKDPDDYIKSNGKDKFREFLSEKKIIQSFIWNSYVAKLDRSDPYAISKFEKEIKKISYSIKDEVLRKYILEDFLEKIVKLTPNQNQRKNYNYKNFKKQNLNILRETRELSNKKDKYTAEAIKEFAILYIMINYNFVTQEKIEEISEIIFTVEIHNELKSQILALASNSSQDQISMESIKVKYEEAIREINANSNIKLILKRKKNEVEILEMFNELLLELKKIKKMKKIESFESELINNFDENSYSELIELKSQLNRD